MWNGRSTTGDSTACCADTDDTMKTGNDQRQPATAQQALLALLRAGLWGQQPDDKAALHLSAREWTDVYRLAGQHTVTALAFQGLSLLPADDLPPQPLLMRWMAETDATERRNRQMNRVLGQLCADFHAGGLNPVLQKGQGVARYYDDPLTRVCGDIDLYFPDKESWDKALDRLRERGIRPTRQADKSLTYVWHGVTVEHHRRLLDLYDPFAYDLARRLERQEGYRHIVLPDTAGEPIAVPAPLSDLLLQYLHILKHAVSRGIGLRQLCDMARACHRLHGETEATTMRKACRELGLGRWCPLLHAFLTTELGLPADRLPYPDTAPTAAPLADIVWRGGNFGQHVQGTGKETNTWQRKWNTVRSFRRNLSFAARYAPKETFWYFMQLLKGQF